MDWTDWTGRLDWTGQLDWTGLILIYIFKCFAPQSFHSRYFYVHEYLPVISYGWPFVSKWVRDVWALIQCIFLTKHFKRNVSVEKFAKFIAWREVLVN